MSKYKCPNCSNELINVQYENKQYCPKCKQNFYYRNGKYVAENEAYVIDWLKKLKNFGINRKQFDKVNNELNKHLSRAVAPNVVVLKILNDLLKKEPDYSSRRLNIYELLAGWLAAEDDDPTKYLDKIAEIYESQQYLGYDDKRPYFLTQKLLGYTHRLIRKREYDEAENLLLKSFPDYAVLVLYRELCDKKAQAAQRRGDWEAVKKHLEDYTHYASEVKSLWLNKADREPPVLTEEQLDLLEEANVQMNNIKNHNHEDLNNLSNID